ncbi:MAG: BBE domain-containing protein, partial [Rhodanobacteraceae bacterium]
DALRAFQAFIRDAPEELNGFFAFLTVPDESPFPEDLHGRKVAGAVWCHNGSQESFDRLTRPLLADVEPLLHAPHEMPFPVLQSLFDALNPPGLQQYWRGDYLPELGDEAIRLHVLHGATLPTPGSIVHLYPLNGAAARVAQEDTAYHHRDAVWSQIIAGVDPDPANAGLLRDWVVGYHEALRPHSAGAGYVNFLMDDEGEQRIRAAYGTNYQRLRQVKRRYDPDNVFRINANIPPAPE